MQRALILAAALASFSTQAAYVPVISCDLTAKYKTTGTPIDGQATVKKATFNVLVENKRGSIGGTFAEMRLSVSAKNPVDGSKVLELVQIYPLTGTVLAPAGYVGGWEYYNSTVSAGRIPEFQVNAEGEFKRGKSGKIKFEMNEEYAQNVLAVEGEGVADLVKALNGAIADCTAAK